MYQFIRSNAYLQTFIILTRLLIGFSFIPSGLTKVLGERFTQIDASHPVGYFFECMFQSGFYWNVLGITQLLAALLLMTQRFATLGAILFLGIIFNICVITISVGFQGTWVITSLMLSATVMLLIWDWNKIKVLFLNDVSLEKINTKSYPKPHNIWTFTGLFIFIFSLAAFLFGRYVTITKDDSWLVLLGIGSILSVVSYALFFSHRNYKRYKKSI